MFDKFGEFNSAEELNKAADRLLNEGDIEGLKALAEENGIDQEDARDFMDEIEKELCSPLMAAMGKLKKEAEELELFGELEFYRTMIEQECQEDPDFALAVRQKGKSMTECMGKLLKAASDARKKVPEKITKAAGLPKEIYTGALTRVEASGIIRGYYRKG